MKVYYRKALKSYTVHSPTRSHVRSKHSYVISQKLPLLSLNTESIDESLQCCTLNSRLQRFDFSPIATSQMAKHCCTGASPIPQLNYLPVVPGSSTRTRTSTRYSIYYRSHTQPSSTLFALRSILNRAIFPSDITTTILFTHDSSSRIRTGH